MKSLFAVHLHLHRAFSRKLDFGILNFPALFTEKNNLLLNDVKKLVKMLHDTFIIFILGVRISRWFKDSIQVKTHFVITLQYSILIINEVKSIRILDGCLGYCWIRNIYVVA